MPKAKHEIENLIQTSALLFLLQPLLSSDLLVLGLILRLVMVNLSPLRTWSRRVVDLESFRTFTGRILQAPGWYFNLLLFYFKL